MQDLILTPINVPGKPAERSSYTQIFKLLRFRQAIPLPEYRATSVHPFWLSPVLSASQVFKKQP